MFSAKPKIPRPTGCCAQQMKRFHSLTAGQPFDTNPVRGAAAPLTTPRKGFFDSLCRSGRFGFFDEKSQKRQAKRPGAWYDSPCEMELGRMMLE